MKVPCTLVSSLLQAFFVVNVVCYMSSPTRNIRQTTFSRAVLNISSELEQEFTDVPFIEAPANTSDDVGEGFPSDSSTFEESMNDVSLQSKQKIFVGGASGFVGTQICKILAEKGIRVVAMSRGGKPVSSESWSSNIEWITGNAIFPDSYKSELQGCTSVISCIGGFGSSNKFMQQLNGECNVKLCETAKDAGVIRYVFISVNASNLPGFASNIGYFLGKVEAENRIDTLFTSSGYILKPALIYGKRKLDINNPFTREKESVVLPLDRIVAPAKKILSQQPFKQIANSGLPFADLIYSEPVSVDAVAKTAIACALGELDSVSAAKKRGAIELKIEDIKSIGEQK